MFKTKRKEWLIVGLSVCLVSLLFIVACAAPAPAPAPAPGPAPAPAPSPAPAPAPKVFKWRMQAYTGAGTPQTLGVEYFADLVREMSNGQIDITVYSAGQIIPSKEICQSLGEGVIELATGAAFYTAGVQPEANFEAGILFFPTNYEEFETTFWDYGVQDFLRESYANNFNVFYLGEQAGSTIDLFTTKKITRVEDLRGMIIRSGGSHGKLLEALGAEVTFLPYGEILTGLQLGTVQGATWGGQYSWVDMGLHDVQPSYGLRGLKAQTNGSVLANLDVWEALPSNLKAILQTACRDSGFRVYQLICSMEEEAHLKCLEAGTEYTPLPPAEWAKIREACEVVYAEFSKDNPRVAKIIELFKNCARDRGYIS